MKIISTILLLVFTACIAAGAAAGAHIGWDLAAPKAASTPSPSCK